MITDDFYDGVNDPSAIDVESEVLYELKNTYNNNIEEYKKKLKSEYNIMCNLNIEFGTFGDTHICPFPVGINLLKQKVLLNIEKRFITKGEEK